MESNDSEANISFPVGEGLPESLRSKIKLALPPNMLVICFARLDINGKGQFDDTVLILGREQLFECSTSCEVNRWAVIPDRVLRSTIHAGLGTLSLLESGELLAMWSYTAARADAVSRLVASFNSVARGEDTVSNSGTGDTSQASLITAPTATKSLLRLVRFAKPHIGLGISGLILTVLATAAGLVWPYLTMPLIDNVLIPWQNLEHKLSSAEFFRRLSPYLIGMVGATLIAWALSWARTYVMSYLSEKISCDLRNETYRHLQTLSLDFYGARRTGDLISRIGSDSDRICAFLSSRLLDFITDVLMIVLTSIILIQLNPILALVSLLPFPLIAWLTHKVRTRLRHGFARSGHAWEAMISVLTDAIPGVRVVKAFAQEQREVFRFQEANRHVLESNIRISKLWSFFGPTVTLLTEIGLLLIWIYGAWLVAHQSITVGKLTLFVTYIGRFYLRLDSMSRMLADTQRAAAASFRVFEILDRQPTVTEPKSPADPGRIQGTLELKNVRFKYGNREVIRGVDLRVRSGELIGLVGSSGSGKSTLVNLVCRFYDATEGVILVDDKDIRSFPIEKYRSNIGIVLQEPYLFFGTIAENIAYGKPKASPAEIIAAARAANAHSFISHLADGYDSMVGERGQGLSGGERQRISIARAILTDPRLLILDEATSAVDNETEREIQAALDNLVRGRTTIAIAHRLSTLRNADRIVVMDQGVIVEQGKHDDLLQLNGVYTRLHQAHSTTI